MPKTMKVLRILDEFRLLISGGREAGLVEGDHVEVYRPGERITDPDTNEDLGSLDMRKAELVVVQVLDRMAITRTAEVEQIPSPFAVTVAQTFGFGRETPKALNIDPKDIDTSLGKFDSRIRVGDLVRKIHPSVVRDQGTD